MRLLKNMHALKRDIACLLTRLYGSIVALCILISTLYPLVDCGVTALAGYGIYMLPYSVSGKCPFLCI